MSDLKSASETLPDFGVRKGAISEAIGEAIEVWLEFKSRQRRDLKPKPRKTEISWSGKDEEQFV